jgi:excisionase family DNA binding protein
VEEDRQKTNTKKARPEPPELDAAEHGKDRKTEYLTAHQLAEVLQVSESTIHRLRRAGRIPAVMLTDRLIRFNLRDVQKALRPTQSARTQSDGDQTGHDEPSPQLSFDDLTSEFSG